MIAPGGSLSFSLEGSLEAIRASGGEVDCKEGLSRRGIAQVGSKGIYDILSSASAI